MASFFFIINLCNIFSILHLITKLKFGETHPERWVTEGLVAWLVELKLACFHKKEMGDP
jgi:hypothetical protein